MTEDFIQAKPRVNKINFFNPKIIIGLILFILAIWMLIWVKFFTPLAIYLVGFSLAILGLAFLLSGVKIKQERKLPPKITFKE